MSKKRGFLDGYRTYDPSKEGYGSVKDWGAAFESVMGAEEAATVIGDDNPFKIFGITKLPGLDELQRLYRKLVMLHHPDRGGDPEMAKKVIAAYAILKDRIERATAA